MISEMLNKRVLVLGVGNVLFGDDGFGPAVANALADQCVLPADVLVADVGTSGR
jgi:hydrogenase maturation protease